MTNIWKNDTDNSTEGKMANISLDVRTGAVKGSPLLFRSSLTSDVRTSKKQKGDKKMNKNLENALSDICKADGVMYAIENTYLDIEVYDDQVEKAMKAESTFYALWDIIKNVQDSLERLAGDEKVVNVIYAVNKVRENESEEP